MVNGQLSWTIGLYVQRLREQERPLEIVDLYTYLTQAEPRNPHYFIALARAYVAVDQTSDALGAPRREKLSRKFSPACKLSVHWLNPAENMPAYFTQGIAASPF